MGSAFSGTGEFLTVCFCYQAVKMFQHQLDCGGSLHKHFQAACTHDQERVVYLQGLQG